MPTAVNPSLALTHKLKMAEGHLIVIIKSKAAKKLSAQSNDNAFKTISYFSNRKKLRSKLVSKSRGMTFDKRAQGCWNLRMSGGARPKVGRQKT